jgi:hypothetical protein
MRFKNSVCTSKKTQDFIISMISWLMLFKEIISVCEDGSFLGCSSVSEERRVTALIMEAVCIPETSVNLYETKRSNIREGSHLQVYLAAG